MALERMFTSILICIFVCTKSYAFHLKFMGDQLSSEEKIQLKLNIENIQNNYFNNLKQFLPKLYPLNLIDLSLEVIFDENLKVDGLFIDPQDYSCKKPCKEFIIKLNPKLIYSSSFYQTFTHEFFHFIHYLINPNEDTFLREGLAQFYSTQVTGIMESTNITALNIDSHVSFFEPYSLDQPLRGLYGMHFLYVNYILSQCLSFNMDSFWKLVKGDEVNKGPKLIDSLLRNSGSSLPQCANFNDSLLNFLVASAHNKSQLLKSDNPDQYYIRPFSQTMKVQNLSPQDLKNLKNYSPYLITVSNFKQLNVPSDLKVYFLQTAFPFSVFEFEPDSEIPYNVLILKIN